MKYILFFLICISSFLHADTVGLPDKTWTMVPSEVYKESDVLAENTLQANQNDNVNVIVKDEPYQEIERVVPVYEGVATDIETPYEAPADTQDAEVVVIPTPTTSPSPMKTSIHTLLKQNFDTHKQIKALKEYFAPLWKFIDENMSLFLLIILLSWLLFYILFYRPLAKKVREFDVNDPDYEKNLRKSLSW